MLGLFRVAGTSMLPTLQPNALVWACKPRLKGYKSGDLVVFIGPRGDILVKRILHFAKDGTEVFVMGDNRDHSWDSRSFGTIPVSKLRGKVRFVLFGVEPVPGLDAALAAQDWKALQAMDLKLRRGRFL